MVEPLSERWYNFYEAIFSREFDRLDAVIERVKRKEKTSETAFYLAEARSKQLLVDAYTITDFWIEDMMTEGRDVIPKVEKMKYTLEAISQYSGRGALRRNLPAPWIDWLNKSFKDLADEFKKFSKYVEEFGQYMRGWSEIKLENQPHIEVSNNLEAEAYALLYGFHGSVADITNLEYERYLDKVKSMEYMLPGIIAVYERITTPSLLDFLNPEDLEIFLKNYLAKDEWEWENDIYPKLKEGLEVLGQFLRRKKNKLIISPVRTKQFTEKIMELWKKDLKERNVGALQTFASSPELRKRLAAKYEYGIEPRLEKL